MKKTIIITTLVTLVTLVSIFQGCNENTSATLTNGLPQDVLKSCSIDAGSFSGWFAGGKPTEHGAVLPANSITFNDSTNCEFYKWSWQMFLWIASPQQTGKYEMGNTIMESPVFYTVSPAGDSGRSFILHKPGSLLRMSSHLPQTGPDRLPVIRDRMGRLFEVEKADANGKAMVDGMPVEIGSIELDENGKPAFKDKAGKLLPLVKAILKKQGNTSSVVKEFKLKDRSIFMNTDGGVIDTEIGQATTPNNDGLMAQNGSLVYYITMANDVFAWYRTGVSQGKLSGTVFPTTAAGRDSICAFARANGVTLADSNALPMEIKTSWVELKGLPNPGSYITMEAMIPDYEKNDTMWIPNGERKATLALIGMHVVGSVKGHPEMIWATFEHKNNTPNAAYDYLDTKNQSRHVNQDAGSAWLLSGNAADTQMNRSHLYTRGDTLFANFQHTQKISAGNCLRMNAWGCNPDSLQPNHGNATAAASNSEIISINNDVFNLLPGKDIRKNYFLIGATWTRTGEAPNGTSYSKNNTLSGAAVGTSNVANSTMETYLQGPTNSCFSCHRGHGTPSLWPDSLSHVFSYLKPLVSQPKEK